MSLNGATKINRFHEYHELDDMIFLVYDYIEGPTLTQLVNHHRLTHTEIKKVLKALIQGIVSLNEQEIVHRDIKPDNLMFTDINDLESLKIIDFGTSVCYSDEEQIGYRICGTPGYIAPAMLTANMQNYDRILNTELDIFSAGIILHLLLFRKHPYNYDSSEEKENSFNIAEIQEMETPCSQAYDLLERMLGLGNMIRCNLQEIISHPFFSDKDRLEIEVEDEITETHLDDFMERSNELRRKFKFMNYLK